jgi:hypothetical protein
VKTSLNLLTRDGAVYVAFSPALTADQYAALMELVKRPTSDVELREALRQWAEANGLTSSFSDFLQRDLP